jgi:ribonuclease P/MRP protein subunit RPP40
MLPLLKSDRRPQKCQVSRGVLPKYIDLAQPPRKHKPFDALWALRWCHTVDILLPAELRDTIHKAEGRQIELGRIRELNQKYAKVIMKLGEVLEGDFFTEYVKKG